MRDPTRLKTPLSFARFTISFSKGRHTDIQAIPAHMALGSPRRDAIKSVVERHKVSLIYHLFLRENGLNSWNRWLKFRLWTRCL